MTSQVDFYLLNQTEAATIANYACRLVNKAYEMGMRIFVLSTTAQQATQLDKLMWTISDANFLPHAMAGSPQAQSSLTKICIGDALPESGEHDLLVNLTQGEQIKGANYARVAEIVSADDNHKAAARSRYAQWRDQDVSLKLHHIQL